MKRVLIIGGGLAGLSAAAHLSKRKIEVTLLEASPKLGGRAYSLQHSTGTSFDNGQHILMGCYSETLRFLELIGALDKVDVQNELSVLFVKRGGAIYRLNADKYFYPLNLLAAILNYRAISLKSRLKIIDLFLDLLCCVPKDLSGVTVKEWLEHERQPEEAVSALWEILTVGTMNSRIEIASAEIFTGILQEIFFTGKNSVKIILPRFGLSRMYVDDSVRLIDAAGGKINLSERVLRFECRDEKIVRIVSNKQIYEEFDFVISAVPAYALKKILDASEIPFSLPEFDYSPILNLHLWLKKNPFGEKFYGLINSKVHWLFNNGDHISITISAADNISNMPSEKILNLILSELENYFPIFQTDLVTDYMIINEKRGTFIPDITANRKRETITSPKGNLIIAGDWINTGLPSTVESAVLSGRLASDSVD